MKRCVIDGTKIASLPHLHAVLARELAFPDWYGRNLDALYDCLTSLKGEAELVICHPEALGEALGRRAQALFDTLDEAAEANPGLKLAKK